MEGENHKAGKKEKKNKVTVMKNKMKRHNERKRRTGGRTQAGRQTRKGNKEVTGGGERRAISREKKRRHKD